MIIVILLVIACVLLLLVAVNVPVKYVGLGWLGLFFFALSVLWPHLTRL